MLLSLTLVVFLKYAENQSPLQFSYTGGQFYFADENNDTSGQIIHRETILRMNKSYTAYSGSTEAFIDSPATFKSSSESLKSNAGLMEPSKEPIKVIKNGVEPINIPMKFKKSKNSKFTQNLDLMKVVSI